MLQQQANKDLVLGPIGNRVIFENQHVRVWELAVEPGKSKGLHRHDLPYVIVPLTAGKIEIESIDGRVYRPDEKVGEAIWRDAGEIHDLKNLGTATYRNVLVEIKI
jgi:quercetin dioxygenase-like cupin family protein